MALTITLAILQTLVQLEPAAQEALPIMRKAITGQPVTDAELKTLEAAAAALNAQAEALGA